MIATFVALLILGLLWGGVYLLMAEGLNLIYGVMKVVNLAHGDFIVLGGLVAFSLFGAFHITPLLSFPLAALLLFGLGALVQVGVLERITIAGPEGELRTLLATFGLAIVLIMVYALGMLFSLQTHRELFASAEHGQQDVHWPMSAAIATLAGVTVAVAIVSEIFVESVQAAADAFGRTAAFVGFIVVALVGGAAELLSAVAGARKNRLDLSVGIALGSAGRAPTADPFLTFSVICRSDLDKIRRTAG